MNYEELTVCYWEINDYFVTQILNIMQIRKCNVTGPLFLCISLFKCLILSRKFLQLDL